MINRFSLTSYSELHVLTLVCRKSRQICCLTSAWIACLGYSKYVVLIFNNGLHEKVVKKKLSKFYVGCIAAAQHLHTVVWGYELRQNEAMPYNTSMNQSSNSATTTVSIWVGFCRVLFCSCSFFNSSDHYILH